MGVGVTVTFGVGVFGVAVPVGGLGVPVAFGLGVLVFAVAAAVAVR